LPTHLVQRQFGTHAEAYVHSPVHAHGESLGRVLALAEPQPHWWVLDIATGGGHTALALAPYVAAVVALDLTAAMLRAAREHAHRRGIAGVLWLQADGASLPLATERFDLITCRVALHHFADPAAAVAAWARVLRPGGRLVLVDNIAPADSEAAAYINAFERQRDPSHVWMYPLAALVAFCQQAGFHIRHCEQLSKPMDFQAWMDRMGVSPSDRAHLHRLLWGSQGQARAFLQPQETPEGITFALHEGIILAVKTA
jgi:ubiquinone/menaquinone biosynthesis C-methylase UbiE